MSLRSIQFNDGTDVLVFREKLNVQLLQAKHIASGQRTWADECPVIIDQEGKSYWAYDIAILSDQDVADSTLRFGHPHFSQSLKQVRDCLLLKKYTFQQNVNPAPFYNQSLVLAAQNAANFLNMPCVAKDPVVTFNHALEDFLWMQADSQMQRQLIYDRWHNYKDNIDKEIIAVKNAPYLGLFKPYTAEATEFNQKVIGKDQTALVAIHQELTSKVAEINADKNALLAANIRIRNKLVMPHYALVGLAITATVVTLAVATALFFFPAVLPVVVGGALATSKFLLPTLILNTFVFSAIAYSIAAVKNLVIGRNQAAVNAIEAGRIANVLCRENVATRINALQLLEAKKQPVLQRLQRIGSMPALVRHKTVSVVQSFCTFPSQAPAVCLQQLPAIGMSPRQF